MVPVEFEALAEQAGGKITANTVAAGVIWRFGALDFLKAVSGGPIRGERSISGKNIKAAELGYAVSEIPFRWAFTWDKGPEKGVLMNGSKAIALGALAADCRFAAFFIPCPRPPGYP
ncbi:MAG: hypothetical protein R2874_00450 [Desulfobacterales bacterium]